MVALGVAATSFCEARAKDKAENPALAQRPKMKQKKALGNNAQRSQKYKQTKQQPLF